MRILTICLVPAIVLAGLAGCAPSEKVREGQSDADAKIIAAGLEDDVKARFSCTGALPWAETYCDLHLVVTTDDFATLESAAAIIFSQPALSVVNYRGISYDGGLSSLEEIRAFDPFITDDMTGGTVTFSSTSSVRIELTTMPIFSELCDLAVDVSAGFPEVSVMTARDASSGAYWRIEDLPAEKPELFDETCAYVDDYLRSLDSLGGFDSADYMASDDLVMIGFDSRTFSKDAADEQREHATDWVDSHDPPMGLSVSVSRF